MGLFDGVTGGALVGMALVNVVAIAMTLRMLRASEFRYHAAVLVFLMICVVTVVFGIMPPIMLVPCVGGSLLATVVMRRVVE